MDENGLSHDRPSPEELACPSTRKTHPLGDVISSSETGSAWALQQLLTNGAKKRTTIPEANGQRTSVLDEFFMGRSAIVLSNRRPCKPVTFSFVSANIDIDLWVTK